jgi:Dolichyl-phosphate-mannose-protein mannosyltransferase
MRLRRMNLTQRSGDGRPAPRDQPQSLTLSSVELVMLSIVALQMIALGLVALVYPPNNYDSMNYHMARVAHWEQNRSIAFYPTGIMMQVRGAPFAEYVIAHLQILLNGDRFANLVQWFAMVVSTIAVSKIAAELKGNRTCQITAALLCVSIPMGILQATSTQNDYVLALWMSCFVALSMVFLQDTTSWVLALGCGLALGLAILTKQTALVYVAPFCLIAGIPFILIMKSRAVVYGLVILLSALALNAGVFLRTMELYGSPLGHPAGLANDIHSPRVVASNMIRSIAINVPVDTDAALINTGVRWTLHSLRLLHELTGLSPVDPRTTLTTGGDAFLTIPSTHEDLAGNPIHTALAALAIAVCAIGAWRHRGMLSLGSLRAAPISAPVCAVALILAFAAFNYSLKWQVWHSRLQLPLFVVGTAVVSVVLFPFRRSAWLVIPIATGVFGFHWTLNNATRPLNTSALFAARPRSELYFANRPDLLPIETAIADAIAGSSCHEIGLRIIADPFEYPLWMLLKERRHPVVFEHLEMHAYVPIPPTEGFKPCAIISAGRPYEGAGPQFVDRQFGGHHLYMSSR